jgi:hypothetical protein
MPAAASRLPLVTSRFAQHACCACRPERDPLPDVKDAKAYLACTLARYSQQHPGKVPALIQAHMPPEAQQKVQALLQAAGVGLV